MRARRVGVVLGATLAAASTLGAARALGAPEIEAPRNDGVVLGSSVDVEVSDADQAPDATIDGAPVVATWTALAYRHRWCARVPLAAPGPHLLEVSVKGGPRARARFQSLVGKGPSVDVGDSVARHFIAHAPPAGLSWNWNPAVFLYGLHRFAQVSPQKTTYTGAIADFYAQRIAQGLPSIDRPDVCAPALGALALARVEGDRVGMPGAEEVAHYLDTEKRDPLGAIDHLGSHSSAHFWARASFILRPWARSIWVDSLMMYGVFSVQWGASQGDAALLDFGAAQPGIFASKLQDPQTGLFTHAWDWKARKPLGARWLRGNGWVGTTIVEMLDELPASHPRRPELVRILQAWARGIEARQMPDGLWDSLVDKPGESYAESSGSALAAYALAKGARLGVLGPDARVRARQAFAALTARLERRSDGDYSVTGTSVATNATPEWIYRLVPQKDDVDYGVGAYLLLASELSGESW